MKGKDIVKPYNNDVDDMLHWFLILMFWLDPIALRPVGSYSPIRQ